MVRDYKDYAKEAEAGVYARFGSARVKKASKISLDASTRGFRVRKNNKRRNSGASTINRGRKLAASTTSRIRDAVSGKKPLAFFKGVLTFSALTALIILGIIFIHSLKEARAFEIKKIEIAGENFAAKEEVARYAAIAERTNLLALDLDELAARIEKHPWVEKAVINRGLPDSLFIRVIERRPAAIVNADLDGAGMRLYLADDKGRLFKALSANDRFDLPQVSGLGREDFLASPDLAPTALAEAISLPKKIAAIGIDPKNVSEVIVLGYSEYKVVVDRPSIIVRLSFEDIERQMARMKQILELNINEAFEIDLNYSDRAIVKLRKDTSDKQL